MSDVTWVDYSDTDVTILAAAELAEWYTAALRVANNQTGVAYTLVLTDAGLVIECDNAAAVTLTVPPNADVAFPVGTVVEVYQMGAGQVTVAPGAGVTLRGQSGLKTAGQYAVIQVWKRGTNEWVVSGNATA